MVQIANQSIGGASTPEQIMISQEILGLGCKDLRLNYRKIPAFWRALFEFHFYSRGENLFQNIKAMNEMDKSLHPNCEMLEEPIVSNAFQSCDML